MEKIIKEYKVIESNIEYDVKEYDNGYKEWYKEGKYHREAGPAIEDASGNKYWYKEEEYHRENGPAIELANGYKEYWYNGEFIKVSSDKEFIKYIKLKAFW